MDVNLTIPNCIFQASVILTTMSFGHCANLTAVVKFLLLVVSIILSITQVLLQQIVMSKKASSVAHFMVMNLIH